MLSENFPHVILAQLPTSFQEVHRLSVRLLETNMIFKTDEISICYEHIGVGYGILTKECVEVIKLVV